MQGRLAFAVGCDGIYCLSLFGERSVVSILSIGSGVVSEIYQHSTSLSQCIQGRDLEMEEVKPHCHVMKNLHPGKSLPFFYPVSGGFGCPCAEYHA